MQIGFIIDPLFAPVTDRLLPVQDIHATEHTMRIYDQ